MRRRFSGWPGSSNSSDPGRADYLQFVHNIRRKNAKDLTNRGLVGTEKMHRAEVGHRFRTQNSFRRPKSWLKATRPTTRWRRLQAFSTALRPPENPKGPRSRSKGPWPLHPYP